MSIPRERVHGSRECLYLSCPLSIYATRRYERLTAIVRREFPQAQLLEARHLYASNAEWRRRWPAVLRRLTRLVFFADPDGWIGRGVWTEITDAAREGLPVFYLSDRGRLTPFASVRLGPPDDASWQRYCRIVPLARER